MVRRLTAAGFSTSLQATCKAPACGGGGRGGGGGGSSRGASRTASQTGSTIQRAASRAAEAYKATGRWCGQRRDCDSQVRILQNRWDDYVISDAEFRRLVKHVLESINKEVKLTESSMRCLQAAFESYASQYLLHGAICAAHRQSLTLQSRRTSSCSASSRTWRVWPWHPATQRGCKIQHHRQSESAATMFRDVPW